MIRIEQQGTGLAEKRVDVTYNAASQFESITRYADLAGTEFVADSTFEYDDRGRLVGLVHSQNSTTFADYQWTYDAADRITGFINTEYTAENVSYTYDDRGQLTGADYASLSDESYTYDENGNRTSGGFTPGTNNQLTTDGTYNYTYDDEGNVIERTNISDGSFTDYEWDHRNRLVSVTDKTSGGTQTQKVTYAYDAFNRLVERTYQTTSGGPVTEGYFIYDGIQMILELDDSGDVDHRVLWGPAVDLALADETGVGDVYWYLTDHLGTVRDVVEDNDGTNTTTLANHIVFDTFGRRTSETNSSLGAYDVGYTGKWFDRDTGLAWHWNRWYNPEIQRWMSEDPIRSDVNGYRYVGNKITSFIDPNGLEEQNGWFYLNPFAYYYSGGYSGLRFHDSLDDQIRQDKLNRAQALMATNPGGNAGLSELQEVQCETRRTVVGQAEPAAEFAIEFTSAGFGGGFIGGIDDALARGRILRPGRPGNPDHIADVMKGTRQRTGVLVPRKVGNRIPDGVGRPGQIVNIRGVTIDPGKGRVIFESERCRANSQIVGAGRAQIRDIRAADPSATIVVTDPARPDAPPIVFWPGEQPPPRGKLPPGTPPKVPFP